MIDRFFTTTLILKSIVGVAGLLQIAASWYLAGTLHWPS